MCTHCVDENTELLKVGSRSVKQGRRQVIHLQYMTFCIHDNEVVMFGLWS